MVKHAIPMIVVLSAFFFACTPIDGGQNSAVSSSASSSVDSSMDASSSSVMTTRNVSYVGVISELGVTSYQEGSHLLTLPDGTSVILRSSDLNLELSVYLGKKVEVRGSVQPTVEAGGTIMSVEEVTVLTTGSSSSVSASESRMCGGIAGIPCSTGFTCVDDLSDSCDQSSGGADCSGLCVPIVESSSSSSSQTKSSVSSITSSLTSSVTSSLSVSRSSSSSSSASSVSSVTKNSQDTALMAKQNYSTPSLWSQQYCTSHIAMCIPAHKNWYFKSFGATTTALWHVEFGMSAIDELQQGTIILNLVTGPSSTTGGSSGQLKNVGADVVGYLDWKGDHFELIGDASLREAIAYMISAIKPYTPGE